MKFRNRRFQAAPSPTVALGAHRERPHPPSFAMGKKGKKGKKGATLDTTPEVLAPFGVSLRDLVATPLGVQCTVVGVKEGALYLQWPGGIVSAATAAPQKVGDKAGLEAYGYSRRPQSAHIQRSLDERERMLYNHRRYGGPAPTTAQYKLPLGPHGAAGHPQFAAYQSELANPGSILKAAGAGGAKPAKKK